MTVNPAFLKRLVLWPLKLLVLGFGLCLFGVLRLLYPICHIRMGELRGYNRVGELGCRAALYLRKCYLKEITPGERDVFLSGNPVNHQFLKMAQRCFLIIVSPFLLMMYRLVRKFIKNSVLWVDLPEFENYHRVFNQTPAILSFTAEEENRGKDLLNQMGVKEGTSFVCFHARDKVYLDQVHSYRSREEWSYHDYRDCDVNNYLQAAEYLASLGIYAIRMGHIVEKELNTSNPYIIDYATKFRTDFGDVYLSAKCKFFICSEGGLSTVPWAFNVPMVYTNGAPMSAVAGWRSTDIFLPKKFWSNKEQRFLSFYESINIGISNWYKSDSYKHAQIEMIENTPEEILGAVKEMNERLDKKWVTKEDAEELQDSYRKNFKPGNIVYGYPSRVSDIFLRSNRNLLAEGKLVR